MTMMPSTVVLRMASSRSARAVAVTADGALCFLGCAEAMIEPGDDQPGADEHRQRQLVGRIADREPAGGRKKYIAASAESAVARTPGPEAAIPRGDDDGRIKLQVRDLEAE